MNQIINLVQNVTLPTRSRPLVTPSALRVLGLLDGTLAREGAPSVMVACQGGTSPRWIGGASLGGNSAKVPRGLPRVRARRLLRKEVLHVGDRDARLLLPTVLRVAPQGHRQRGRFRAGNILTYVLLGHQDWQEASAVGASQPGGSPWERSVFLTHVLPE